MARASSWTSRRSPADEMAARTPDSLVRPSQAATTLSAQPPVISAPRVTPASTMSSGDPLTLAGCAAQQTWSP